MHPSHGVRDTLCVKMPCKTCLRVGMIHGLIIPVDIGLRHPDAVNGIAVIDIGSVHEMVKPAHRKIRPFALLTRHIVCNETSRHLRIDYKIVQAPLYDTVADMCRRAWTYFGICQREAFRFARLIFACAKFSFQSEHLSVAVRNGPCNRPLPHRLPLAFLHGVKQCFRSRRIFK